MPKVSQEVGKLLQSPEVGDNQNSDHHIKNLDELRKAMSMEVWGKVFKQWREHPAAAKKYPAAEYPVLGTGREESVELDALHGIRWGVLLGAAEQLGNLSKSREALGGEVKALQGRLDEGWEGQAADAAREQYHKLNGPVQEYCDAAKTFSDELRKAASVPRMLISEGDKCLGGFANEGRSKFFQLYGNDDNSEDIVKDIEVMRELVDKPQMIGANVLKFATSPFHHAVQERARQVAIRDNGKPKVDAFVLGQNNQNDMISNPYVKLEWADLRLQGVPPPDNGIRDQFQAPKKIEWLDTFCAWYALDVKNLRKRIHEAYKGTLEAWDALASALDELDEDPFAKLTGGGQAPPSEAKPQQPQGNPASGGPESSGQSAAGPAGGGGAGAESGSGGEGGAAGAAGPATSGSAGAPPPPQPPQMPPPAAPSPEPPQPPAGAPGGMPGGGMPGGMPGGGTPGGTPGSGGPQPPREEVVGEGPGGVKLQEPDPQGNTKVTVMGEDGQPKSYDLALGGGEQPAPGQPGPAGQPGGPALGGDTPIQPGEDGKAVIHEGDRTITVERTPEGPMNVSVDNGPGQPQINETVDFANQPPEPGQGPGQPAPPGDPAAAQQPGPGAPQPPGPGGPGGGGGSDSFGSASGQLGGGGGAPGGEQPELAPGAKAGATGMGEMGPAGAGSPQGATGMAGMGEEGGGAPSGGGQSGQAGAGAGGAPMMGGGGMGGGMGQQGGEQERANSGKWRTEGQIFDDGADPSSKVQYQAVIGEGNQK